MSIISPSRRWFSHPVKESIRFGVELEFISRCSNYIDRYCDLSLSGWEVGCDPSVFDTYGKQKERILYNKGWFDIELKSPVVNIGNFDLFVSDLSKILMHFRHDSVVTRSSGFHVHVSSSDYRVCVDADKMHDYFENKYLKRVWPDRMQYCTGGRHLGKYSIVHCVYNDINHIEVRAFNGTLGKNVVVERVLEVIKVYLNNSRIKKEGIMEF